MKKLYCLYCLFTIVLLCMACPVKGQAVAKKNLTPSEYGRWSSITIDKASDKGRWVSYMVQYPGQKDTLCVRNNKATKTYTFPKGFDGKFIREDYFACRMQDASLHVLDLKQGKVARYPDISQYGISANGKYIISISGNALLIRELKGHQRLLVQGVRSFSLSPGGNALCYSGPEGVGYLDLTSKVLDVKKIYGGMASAFAWQQNGESLAFISTYQTEAAAVLWYHIGKNRLLQQDTLHGKSLGAIAPRPFKFSISDDGERVFYALKGDDVPKVTANVEIWNSSDPMTYDESALKGPAASYQKTAVWWPGRKIAFRLTDSLRTSVFLSGSQQYAITYNPRGTKPYFDYYPLTDYYITDLATQKTKLLLKDHTLSQSDITASPSGRYIAYQKAGSWWLYHTDSGKHISLSGISPGFDTTLAENSLWDVPAIAGWSQQDTKMYFFDTFDLWVIDTETLTFNRMTHGREKGIKFRPADGSIGMQRMNFDGFTLPEIDHPAAIRLLGTATAGKKTAFYRIGTKVQKRLEADKSVTQITPVTHGGFYYVEQAYDTPPAIRYVDSRGKNTLVYQSNPQHKNFYWGNVTLISYRNGENKELQGLLYYPANYDPLKKYPMVVYVYETLSNGLHSYINPSGANYTGFNITNLLSRGYLVLCPDIAYRIGDVGKSAADCIVSATQTIVATGVADKDRIALFGHSFGGYEAAFTATQTGMFKTIIAGAAITDLTSAYLGISDNSRLPNIWRFEHQQWRMGKSLFEIPDNYHRNSTVVHAEKITTPLLLFSGKKDGQVDFRQSRELYLALRRMGKPVIMLLYPGEGHVLLREENQRDLTARLQEWLAYFLQDATVPVWMKKEFDK